MSTTNTAVATRILKRIENQTREAERTFADLQERVGRQENLQFLESQVGDLLVATARLKTLHLYAAWIEEHRGGGKDDTAIVANLFQLAASRLKHGAISRSTSIVRNLTDDITKQDETQLMLLLSLRDEEEVAEFRLSWAAIQ